MTGWIVAGLIGIPLSLIALHFIKKCTVLKVDNENLRKQVETLQKQMAIASRPNASGADILDKLSSSDL